MKKYENLSGRSGIAGYEYGSDYITVYFKITHWSGITLEGMYNPLTYTYSTAGVSAVETMKELADNGKGLNTYIGNGQFVFLSN